MYEELQTSDAPPHLVAQYEEVISSLMADVRNIENQSKKMEEKFARYDRDLVSDGLKTMDRTRMHKQYIF